jgi:hypothetical protein
MDDQAMQRLDSGLLNTHIAARAGADRRLSPRQVHDLSVRPPSQADASQGVATQWLSGLLSVKEQHH